MVAQWVATMQALVGWLDWTEWLRCEEACAWDVSFPFLSSSAWH